MSQQAMMSVVSAIVTARAVACLQQRANMVHTWFAIYYQDGRLVKRRPADDGGRPEGERYD